MQECFRQFVLLVRAVTKVCCMYGGTTKDAGELQVVGTGIGIGIGIGVGVGVEMGITFVRVRRIGLDALFVALDKESIIKEKKRKEKHKQIKQNPTTQPTQKRTH